MLKQPHQTRKIRPTRRSVSGIHAFRGETSVPYESTLERDFLIRTEFSLSVLDVIPQPVRIPFEGNGGRHHYYTPDFLVYYRLGSAHPDNYPKPLLVEVKPEEEWRQHWRDWKTKWKAARNYARQQGWEFRILDESRIRDQALQNIRILEPYKRMQFPVEESQWILKNLSEMGCATFDYLLTRHFMGIYRAEGISHLRYLLATREIECNIKEPFHEFTELWVPGHE